MSKHRLIEKLTSDALAEMAAHGLCVNTGVNTGHASKKPGYRIKQLSEHERELLKTATSDDFKWRGFK